MRILWLLTALARLLWLLPALPAAALTPGTTASPPKATQNWWDAFFAPEKPQALLLRDDSTRLRRGTREDAPRIRQLWAANVARCAREGAELVPVLCEGVRGVGLNSQRLSVCRGA